jgi:hypothetical protein
MSESEWEIFIDALNGRLAKNRYKKKDKLLMAFAPLVFPMSKFCFFLRACTRIVFLCSALLEY